MKWIFRGLFLVVMLAVLGIGAVFLIPSERIAGFAETKFQDMTGRALTLSGDVRPSIWPRLGVSLEAIAVENAAWAGPEPMLEADRLDLGVDLGRLIGGEIVVSAARVENPQIRLHRNAEGVANWDFLTELGGGESGGETPTVSLPLAEITGGTLSFHDEASGQSHRLDGLEAALRLPDLGGRGELSLRAETRAQPIAVEAAIDGVQGFLDGGLQAISTEIKLGGSQLRYDGKLSLSPLQSEGQISADMADLDAVFALIEAEKPRIPPGLGQHPKLQGALTMTSPEAIALRDVVIDLDQNRLQGDIDLSLAGKPRVTARLSAGALDFSAMSTDTSEADGAANVTSGGWSTAAIDISGLDAVDGAFALDLGAVDFGSVQIVDARIDGALERSRLVLDLTRVGAFDGVVSGQFVVNGRGGLSVGGDLQASGVAMQRVLRDFAGYDRLIGDAGMALRFLASGQNMDQIMKNISGEGRVDIGTGAIEGLDIIGMIRNLDSSFRGEGVRTVFNSITASYTIADGVLRNEDLQFDADLATATGTGALDLGGQSVEYRLEPVALAQQLGAGLSVPVLITGPWSDIRFRPDLKALADRELAEERARLEAAAKAKEDELKARAARKIEEELGVSQQEGQSLEDQLRDGLEDRAKDRLKGLLGLGGN